MLLFCLNFIQNFCLAKMFCPLCETTSEKFISEGEIKPRLNAMCPNCKSFERQRHLWLFLKRYHSEIFSKKMTILHWAPEGILCKKLGQHRNLAYIGADLFPINRVGCSPQKLDITRINLESNSIDAVICSHVLEHVPEDRKALLETMRILKPGGWAIFMVPIYNDLKATYEDASITAPEDRKKAFDQRDHVRKYGWDILQRMKDSGFIVSTQLLKDLPLEQREYYGLNKYEDVSTNARQGADIIFCKKPN